MRGFFRGVPETLRAAFVVVTHLGREHKSLLPDVLARFTPLKVEAAADGVLVAPAPSTSCRPVSSWASRAGG